MRAINIKQILGVILLSGLVFADALGQDERLTREMTLEREYDPTIQDANKINRLPEVREPEIVRRTIEYSPFTKSVNPEKEIMMLPSGDFMTEIPTNQRRGYFNFGGGMFMNLNGDLGYHFLNDEKDKLNFYFSHRSTNGNVEYLQFPEVKQKAVLNDNLAVLEYNHYFNPSIFRLGGSFGYTQFNYYGLPSFFTSPVDPIDSLADRTTKQGNQTINAYAGIQSKVHTSIGYLLDIEFLRFTQKYGLANDLEGVWENRYTFQAGLSSKIGDGSRRAGLAGKLNIFNYEYPLYPYASLLGNTENMEVTVTPYYQLAGDNWNVQLGANLMVITGDSSKLFVSPNILLEAEVADKTVFYANAGGEIQSNDAYSLSRQNRYMNYARPTSPSRTWLDAMLGIRTGVVPNVWFDVFVGYKITENEMFLVPDAGDLLQVFSVLSSSHSPSSADTRFRSYYTTFQPDASLFRAGATLKYKYRNIVDFSVKGVYNNWAFRAGDGMVSGNFDIIKPYGRPAIELNVDLTIRPINPLALTFNYYLGSDRYTIYRSIDTGFISDKDIKLNDINDLNFMASWNFNQTFGAYLKLNNLLFQKQELWHAYPMQGFNAMAGINLNF